MKSGGDHCLARLIPADSFRPIFGGSTLRTPPNIGPLCGSTWTCATYEPLSPLSQRWWEMLIALSVAQSSRSWSNSGLSFSRHRFVSLRPPYDSMADILPQTWPAAPGVAREVMNHGLREPRGRLGASGTR